MLSPPLWDSPPLDRREGILKVSGAFTGIFTLTWIGAEMIGAPMAIQGGLAVGGIMSISGLAAIWWKTLNPEPHEGEA